MLPALRLDNPQRRGAEANALLTSCTLKTYVNSTRSQIAELDFISGIPRERHVPNVTRAFLTRFCEPFGSGARLILQDQRVRWWERVKSEIEG